MRTVGFFYVDHLPPFLINPLNYAMYRDTDNIPRNHFLLLQNVTVAANTHPYDYSPARLVHFAEENRAEVDLLEAAAPLHAQAVSGVAKSTLQTSDPRRIPILFYDGEDNM
jgi:hypothetical protein